MERNICSPGDTASSHCSRHRIHYEAPATAAFTGEAVVAGGLGQQVEHCERITFDTFIQRTSHSDISRYNRKSDADNGRRATMSYYFAIVGTQDNPLFEYEFGTSKQGGDGQSRFNDQVQHLNQFILHSSLDMAEELQWAGPGNMCVISHLSSRYAIATMKWWQAPSQDPTLQETSSCEHTMLTLSPGT